MAAATAGLGKLELALRREGEERNLGGDGVFPILAELVEVMVEAGEHFPGLFIGGTVRRDIFSGAPRILLPAHAFKSKAGAHSATLSAAWLRKSSGQGNSMAVAMVERSGTTAWRWG